MLELSDGRWKQLEGGYRVPYDAGPALQALVEDKTDEEAWSELWENLHHQGDVGVASYAAVPQLVRIFGDGGRNWQLYALIATIEVQRHKDGNPDLPLWLKEEYGKALGELLGFAAEDLLKESDDLFTRGILAAVAAAKGQYLRADLMIDLTDDELAEMVNRYRNA